jgi:hypothetical protein
MCRDILNSCVRNTEEAERASQVHIGDVDVDGHGNGVGNGVGVGTGGSGRGLGKGVWNMIEESELAKSIRLDEKSKVTFPSSHHVSGLRDISTHADQNRHRYPCTGVHHPAH